MPGVDGRHGRRQDVPCALVGQSSTTLSVSPYNTLVSKNTKEGRRASTLHNLVGRLAVETEEGAAYKKACDLEGVTHVFFDEVYLYPVGQLGWVRDFMRQHPELTYSMAGDPCQNAPVRQELYGELRRLV